MADNLAEDAHPETPQPVPAAKPAPVLALVFAVGATALLGAMATDFVGVICRHLGVPFIGAIEIIQACIVFTISAAVIAATLTKSHATVHLVTERLPPVWQARLARVSDALAFLTFAAIAAGDVWLLYDTRDWDERSDLLGLPIWPLRVVWTASLVVVCLLFLVRVLRPAPSHPVETRP